MALTVPEEGHQAGHVLQGDAVEQEALELGTKITYLQALQHFSHSVSIFLGP